MPKVLQSLLIGIGFQPDKKSAQNVESQIDGITNKALQLGTVFAGAFGAQALTFGFAEEIDALGKFSDRWGVTAESVSAYDRALQHAGGTTGEFLGTIQSLTQLQALAGQDKAGLLAGLAPQGISSQVSQVINAQNALEGFLNAADALQSLDVARQERFIQALGFSDAEVTLLRSGRSEILRAVEAERKLRPVTDEMTSSAANFNDQWQDLNTNISGFSDKTAVKVTGAIAGIIGTTNEWIGANRELINSLAEFGGDLIADNIELIGGGLAILASGTVIAGLKSVAALVGGISASIVAGAAAAAPFVAAAGGAYAILTQGSEGEAYSAGGIFGDNAVTRFLDTPINELFSPRAGTQATPGGYLQGQPVQVTIPISLDGRVIETKVIDVLDQQADQAIQDLSTSEGG